MHETTIDRHPRRLFAWLSFVLALAALNYAGRFSGVETDDDLAYRYSTAVAAVVQYAVMLGIALLIARGLPTRRMFGLSPPASWRRALGIAAVALVAIYVVSLVYVQVLSLFTDENPSCEQGIAPTEWDPARAGAFAAFFVAVVVLAPIVEELIYRGLGFALLRPYGPTLAIVLTGLLFGLTHGLVLGLPVLAAFGVIVGWVRWRTGSSFPGMALHGTFNGVALVAALLVDTPC